MDVERPHFRTTSIGSSSASAAPTTELFICFPSRLSSSSSSMKLSKSILSPGRAAREVSAPVTLTPSLSRRLRSNGSIKGSPFATGRKRGCSFENPEPSSPKVTCIGQVRVKTKKKGKKQTRSLSRRRSGDVSFRKVEQGSTAGVEDGAGGGGSIQQQRGFGCSAPECTPHRNQRWVHLPVSICETLRGFGDEFTCFFPCKNSCFSTNERNKVHKRTGSNQNDSGCGGSVCGRWLVPVNDGESGRRRDIELVVGGRGEAPEPETSSLRGSRRHVFEDIEVKNDKVELKGQRQEDEDATMSICIPPKNALLLMRCRSDPMKMASLMNRFNSEAPRFVDIEEESLDYEEQEATMQCKYGDDEAATVSEEFEEETEKAHIDIKVQEIEELVANSREGVQSETVASTQEESEAAANEDAVLEEVAATSQDECTASNVEEGFQDEPAANDQDEEEFVQEIEWTEESLLEVEDVESNISSFEALLEQENTVEESPAVSCEESPVVEDEEQVDIDASTALSSPASDLDEEGINRNEEEATESEEPNELEDQVVAIGEEEQQEPEMEAQQMNVVESNEEEEEEDHQSDNNLRDPDRENQELADENADLEKETTRLPECLLLMMCEPKLSMEISKETWVCNTDFIRWLPERPLKQPKTSKDGGESIKRRLSVDSKPKPNSQFLPPLPEKSDTHRTQQPARSSCSLPAAVAAASMASMIEQKLVNGVGYEGFVLTRCKSEPMRTAASKLMPDLCFWKNTSRKVEPQRRAELGVGAAGV